MPFVQRAAEVCVVLCWSGGCVRAVMLNLGLSQAGWLFGACTWLLSSCLVPFVIMCFAAGGMDTSVLGLLVRDFQFIVMCGLTTWLVAVHMWTSVLAGGGGGAAVMSALHWSPCMSMAVLDAIGGQSVPFRAALAPVYLFYLLLNLFYFGYSGVASENGVLLLPPNTKLPFTLDSVFLTGGGQISSALSSLAALQLVFIFGVARDLTHSHVSFPLKLRLLKEHVQVRFGQGGGGSFRPVSSSILGSIIFGNDAGDEFGPQEQIEHEQPVDHPWNALGDEPGLPSYGAEADDQVSVNVQQRSWKGAVGFGLVGGTTGVWSNTVASWTGLAGYSLEFQLVAFAVGFAVFGLVGYVVLPPARPLVGAVRRLLELLVVLGWLGGFVNMLPFPGIILRITGVVLFNLSPLPFACLCWNALDWTILHLLARQLQFWTVIAISVWLIIVGVWSDCMEEEWLARHSLMYAIAADGLLTYFPYIIIVFLDAIRDQSRAFRVGLPVAYILFAGANIFQGGFSGEQKAVVLYQRQWPAVQLTDLRLLVNSQVTVLIVTASFLLSVFRDPEGLHICFPLRSRVRRRAAGLVSFDAASLLEHS